jgi:hypothetical protein
MRLSLTSVARRILVLSLVLGVVLVAAARAQAVTPIVRPGWISGSVTWCSDRICVQPARALVTAAALDSQGTTSTAKTEAKGTFLLTLNPGLYLVSAASLGPDPQQSKPMLVRVYPLTTTTIRIDLPT